MEIKEVISTTIRKLCYIKEDKIMQVEFNSGTTYKYFDVSQEEFDSIKDDYSPGSKLRKVTKEKEYKKYDNYQ